MIACSGRRFDPAAPSPEAVAIDDIAEHLARLVPSPGTTAFYCFAQRALLLAEAALAGDGEARSGVAALLYYAPRAYCADSGTWTGWARAIHARFGLSHLPALQQRFTLLHERLLLTEYKTLYLDAAAEIAALEARGVRPLPRAIRPLPQHAAAERYRETWRRWSAAVPECRP